MSISSLRVGRLWVDDEWMELRAQVPEEATFESVDPACENALRIRRGQFALIGSLSGKEPVALHRLQPLLPTLTSPVLRFEACPGVFALIAPLQSQVGAFMPAD